MKTSKSRKMLGKSFLRNGICVAIVVGLTVIATSCDKKETTSFPTIEIGWQVAWATQGQIAMALQRTTALETMRLKGDFKSFTYGAPMSEVALAGQLDVAFVGDQPAVSLLSRSTDWKIVARLMDFRVAIVVSPASSIQTVADLKGKTLGIPFGASTHRVALEMLKEAGLDPDKDLKIINIDILEQSDVVKAAAGCPWPKVDAFASWDHHIALYEKQGYARILKSGTALGVVIMSQKFIESKPKEAAKFLAAFKLAYLYYATHQEEVDRWFAEAAGGKFDVSILKTVAEVESNMKAPDLSHVRIDIGTRQITTLQQAADFAFAQGLIKQPLSIQNAVTTAVLQEAEKLINPPTQLTIGVHEKNQ